MMLNGGDTALIVDSLLMPAEEAIQPCYQAGMETQTHGLGDDKSGPQGQRLSYSM